MDINLATNTTLSLLNRIGRSDSDNAFEIDGNIQEVNSPADSYSASGDDNYHTFLIKDNLEAGGYVYSSVLMHSERLDTLSNFLVELRDVELLLATQTEGSAEYTSSLIKKQEIEVELSRFVGSNVHTNDLNLITVQGDDSNTSNNFMEIYEIFSDPSDPSSNVIGMVSSIEVELGELFATAHNEATCPHCIAAAQEGVAGVEQPEAFATSSAEGATPDKTRTSFGETDDPQVETLRKGRIWNIGSNDQLTYSFYESDGTSPAYQTNYNGGDTSSGANGLEEGITANGPDNTTALSQVMGEWDKAVDFDFLRVIEDAATGQVGDIRMAFTSDGEQYGRAAFAYYPSNTAIGGDIWFETHDIGKNFDDAGNDFNSTGLGDGGYSWYAALHEVGHALGLSHPFDEGSASGATLPNEEDNLRTSVMSYTQLDRNKVFSYERQGAFWSTSSSYNVYATTPMLADVKAMALMYGAETTSDGDTNYSFEIDNDRNQSLMLQTIIDTGGVDTIDLSNQTRSSTLDMNGGALSSIGVWSEADQIAYWRAQTGLTLQQVTDAFDTYNTQAIASGKSTGAIYTGEDNLAIAFNAEIENAIGGFAADTIVGNTLDNMITGGGGDDIIDGGDGVDIAVYSGDRYSYTITDNGDGTTSVTGADGADTLSNIEGLQFIAGQASVRGASAISSLKQAADLTGTSTFNISVDGEAEVTVTFTGSDYTSGGLTIENLKSDLQDAINNALNDVGQLTSVSVTQNSPIQITSNNKGEESAIAISSLSGPLQAALGDIQLDERIQVGDTVYYGMGSGAVTIGAPSGNFSSSNPQLTETTNAASTNLAGVSNNSSGNANKGFSALNNRGVPNNIGSISLKTQEDAAIAVLVLDKAIEQITQSQAKLGAIQNRLDYNIANLTKASMLTETAKGRIIDADFASETAILVKNQILAQAATQALNMANQSRQGVLGLLG